MTKKQFEYIKANAKTIDCILLYDRIQLFGHTPDLLYHEIKDVKYNDEEIVFTYNYNYCLQMNTEVLVINRRDIRRLDYTK